MPDMNSTVVCYHMSPMSIKGAPTAISSSDLNIYHYKCSRKAILLQFCIFKGLATAFMITLWEKWIFLIKKRRKLEYNTEVPKLS